MSRFKPPLTGSFIETPEAFARKRATINPFSDDNRCFVYATVAAVAAASPTTPIVVRRNLNKMSTLKKLEKSYGLKTDMIQYPVSLQDVKVFEKVNNIPINIYSAHIKHTTVKPLRFSKINSENAPVNLLMLYGKHDEQHFIAITNINRLLNSKGRHQYFYCQWCLFGFTTETGKNRHQDVCLKGGQQVKLPVPSQSKVTFSSYKALAFQPFVLYADFESAISNESNDASSSSPSSPASYSDFDSDSSSSSPSSPTSLA